MMNFNYEQFSQQAMAIRGQEWEVAYNSNIDDFTTLLSQAIGQQCLTELQELLIDPYSQIPTKNACYRKVISLQIYKKNVASELRLLSKDAASLPPFKEWLDTFSVRQRDLEDNLSSSSMINNRMDHKIDQKYFKTVMSVVGRETAEKLNIFFVDTLKEPGNAQLNFQAKWISKDDQFLSNLGCFLDFSLVIEAWGESSKSIPSTFVTDLQGSHLQKARIQNKHSELQRRAMLVGVAAVLVISYIAYSVLFLRSSD